MHLQGYARLLTSHLQISPHPRSPHHDTTPRAAIPQHFVYTVNTTTSEHHTSHHITSHHTTSPHTMSSPTTEHAASTAANASANTPCRRPKGRTKPRPRTPTPPPEEDEHSRMMEGVNIGRPRPRRPPVLPPSARRFPSDLDFLLDQTHLVRRFAWQNSHMHMSPARVSSGRVLLLGSSPPLFHNTPDLL